MPGENSSINNTAILFTINREIGEINGKLSSERDGRWKMEKGIKKIEQNISALHKKVDEQGKVLDIVKKHQEQCPYQAPPPAKYQTLPPGFVLQQPSGGGVGEFIAENKGKLAVGGSAIAGLLTFIFSLIK